MRRRYDLIVIIVLAAFLITGLGSWFLIGEIVSRYIAFFWCTIFWGISFTYDLNKNFKRWCNKPLKKINGK